MADQPTVRLNTGTSMPQLGFGVFQVPNDQATAAVLAALDAGYRSIDTKPCTANEEGDGKVTAQLNPRDDLFITTKLNNNAHGTAEARRAFEESLSHLGLDYLDLYLIHWPLPAQDRYVETWRALRRSIARGRPGRSAFRTSRSGTWNRLFEETEVVPAVNQIELHPYLTQEPLRAFHVRQGIATESWSPLAKGGELLSDPDHRPVWPRSTARRRPRSSSAGTFSSATS